VKTKPATSTIYRLVLQPDGHWHATAYRGVLEAVLANWIIDTEKDG